MIRVSGNRMSPAKFVSELEIGWTPMVVDSRLSFWYDFSGGISNLSSIPNLSSEGSPLVPAGQLGTEVSYLGFYSLRGYGSNNTYASEYNFTVPTRPYLFGMVFALAADYNEGVSSYLTDNGGGNVLRFAINNANPTVLYLNNGTQFSLGHPNKERLHLVVAGFDVGNGGWVQFNSTYASMGHNEPNTPTYVRTCYNAKVSMYELFLFDEYTAEEAERAIWYLSDKYEIEV